MMADFHEMRKATRNLNNLTRDFIVAYTKMAENIPWDGISKEQFLEVVSKTLDMVSKNMEEVSRVPSDAAVIYERAENDMQKGIATMLKST